MPGFSISPGLDFAPPVTTTSALDNTGATDVTARLNSLFAGGSVALPPGTFKVSGQVVVPINGGSFIGSGSGQTVLRLGPSGSVVHGNISSPGTGQGGVSQGFTVDGAGVAPIGLYVGSSTGRTFNDVVALNTTGDAAQLQTTQNCLFNSCSFGSCAGNALTLDRGAGGNVFTNCELIAADGYAISLQQSAATPIGFGYSTAQGPSDNTFYACRLEVPGKTVPGTALGMINHSAGTLNTFHGCGISANAATGSFSLISQSIGGLASTSLQLMLTNCGLIGPGTATSWALTMSGGTTAKLTNCFIAGFQNAYKTSNLDQLSRTDVTLSINSAEWVQSGGAATNCTTVLMGQDKTPWVPLTYAANWGDAGGAYPPGAFRRTGNRIKLRGFALAAVGATGTIATGLPNPVNTPAFPTLTAAVLVQVGGGSLITNGPGTGVTIPLSQIQYDLDE